MNTIIDIPAWQQKLISRADLTNTQKQAISMLFCDRARKRPFELIAPRMNFILILLFTATLIASIFTKSAAPAVNIVIMYAWVYIAISILGWPIAFFGWLIMCTGKDTGGWELYIIRKKVMSQVIYKVTELIFAGALAAADHIFTALFLVLGVAVSSLTWHFFRGMIKASIEAYTNYREQHVGNAKQAKYAYVSPT